MLRTNIDGGTINVDMSDYQIKNDSSMRVQLTALVIREKENADAYLQKKDTKVTTGDRDTCHISLKRDWKNHNLYAADSSKADGYNPIDQIEISPLSFLTTPDERKGVYLTSFYYTISIPKTND
jgi:hypothetical protein